MVAHKGSTKIFIPVQKYFSQYLIIPILETIFLSQYKIIYSVVLVGHRTYTIVDEMKNTTTLNYE